MKKRIIIIPLIAIIIGLLTWRFWSHPSSKILSAEADTITGVSGYTIYAGVKNGAAYNESYSLEFITSKKEIQEILAILNMSDYKQDFRNLLPWIISDIDTDQDFDGNIACLQFDCGNEADEYVSIRFLSKSIMTVETGATSGLRIYHPTNPEVLADLVEYLQTHGVESFDG